MDVRVDRDRCQGHGVCHMISPEVFDLDDEGHAFVTVDPLTPDLEDAAQNGVDACPELAIEMSAGS